VFGVGRGRGKDEDEKEKEDKRWHKGVRPVYGLWFHPARHEVGGCLKLYPSARFDPDST
jgi:hypothetical protein